jgi:nucleobase:cation symporter-1, NCS1 family
MRKWRYVPGELQRTDRGGLYWGTGGVHWPAIVAQAVGSTASVLALDQSFYAGPIARAAGGGGADFSVFTGIVAAAVVYLVLATRSVGRQAQKQEAMLAAAETAA